MTGQIFGEEPAADDRHAPGVDPTVGSDPAATRLDAGPTRQEPEPQAGDSPEAKSETNPDPAHPRPRLADPSGTGVRMEGPDGVGIEAGREAL